MAAVDLLIELAERAFWRGQKEQELRRPMKVGELYNSLPEEDKEVLRTLTSNDTKKIRPDAVTGISSLVGRK